MTRRLDEQAFVLPSGAQLKLQDDGFIIGNPGDVIIHGAPSFKVHQLTSTNGSVHLHSDTPLTLTRVEARQGEVRLSGNLHVQTVLARRVQLVSGNLSVRSIVAEESISLHGESLAADIIIAPSVEISDRLKGRATVIESKNDTGPTLLKGNFRLEEYLEIFPNGRETIEQNPDVQGRLEGWKELKLSAKSSEPAGASSGASGAGGRSAPAAVEEEVAASITSDFVGEDAGEASGEGEGDVVTLTEEVDAVDPTVDVEEAEDGEAMEAAHDDEVEDLYNRLSENFLKIMGCYSDLKLPPPLNTLENLIEDRKFDALKRQLTGLWNELLQYHKREGLHIANAVTHNIQEMKRLLQDRA